MVIALRDGGADGVDQDVEPQRMVQVKRPMPRPEPYGDRIACRGQGERGRSGHGGGCAPSSADAGQCAPAAPRNLPGMSTVDHRSAQ